MYHLEAIHRMNDEACQKPTKKPKPMTFAKAMKALKRGSLVGRAAWAESRYLSQNKDGDIHFRDWDGSHCTFWTPTQYDVRACDWYLYF